MVHGPCGAANPPAWKMVNARKVIQNYSPNSPPWTNMDFPSIFDQMAVALTPLEASTSTTSGLSPSALFFPQHLTVTSMLSAPPRLGPSSISSNIFKKVQIWHRLKSMTEMKSRDTQRAVISLHQKQAITSINLMFMDKC